MKQEILRALDITFQRKHSYGYYVWSSETIPKQTIAKYIARYVKHPAIANSRIKKYDKEGVTFSYKNAFNELLVKKSVNNFITSLIQHIPPKQFKMV
jgi:transcriptional antiterminator